MCGNPHGCERGQRDDTEVSQLHENFGSVQAMYSTTYSDRSHESRSKIIPKITKNMIDRSCHVHKKGNQFYHNRLLLHRQSRRPSLLSCLASLPCHWTSTTHISQAMNQHMWPQERGRKREFYQTLFASTFKPQRLEPPGWNGGKSDGTEERSGIKPCSTYLWKIPSIMPPIWVGGV